MIETRPPARLKAFKTESLTDIERPKATIVQAASAPLSTFIEDPNNPRKEFDPHKHDELVNDVKERGILQPIVVVATEDGKLKIRHGARRFRAARDAGLQNMPYTLQVDPRQLDSFAQIAENEIRENHTAMDLARFVDEMVTRGMKHQDIAAKLHKTPATITYLASLVTSPPFILELYETGKCTHAEKLYHLRKLWEANGAIVERRCATQDTLTDAFIRNLKQSLDEGEGKEGKPKRKSKKRKATGNGSKPKSFYQITSAEYAEKMIKFKSRDVAIIAGGMIVRGHDGIEVEIAGDEMASLILAANG